MNAIDLRRYAAAAGWVFGGLPSPAVHAAAEVFHPPVLVAHDEHATFAIHETALRTFVSHGTQLGRFTPLAGLDWKTDAHPGLPAQGRILRLDVLAADTEELLALVELNSDANSHTAKREEYRLASGTWSRWTPQSPRLSPGEYLGATWEFVGEAGQASRLLRVYSAVEDDAAVWTGIGLFNYRECATNASWRAHEVKFDDSGRSIGRVGPSGLCVRSWQKPEVGSGAHGGPIWIGYDENNILTVVDERTTRAERIRAPVTYKGQRCYFTYDDSYWMESESWVNGVRTPSANPPGGTLGVDATPHCVNAKNQWSPKPRVQLVLRGHVLVVEEGGGLGLGGLSGEAPSAWSRAWRRPAMRELRDEQSRTHWLREPSGAFAWPIDWIDGADDEGPKGKGLVLTAREPHETTESERRQDLAPRGTSLFLLSE